MNRRMSGLGAAAFVVFLLWGGSALAWAIPYLNAGWWNQSGIQSSNNCYNYAMNKATGTFAQPGRAVWGGTSSGADMQCNIIKNNAVIDGYVGQPQNQNKLIWTDQDAGPCADPTWTKVALVVAPGWDYHWYRRDNNGYWSHKPGGSPATSLDSCSQFIFNPAVACRGIYTNFCGYACTASNNNAQNTGTMNIN